MSEGVHEQDCRKARNTPGTVGRDRLHEVVADARPQTPARMQLLYEETYGFEQLLSQFEQAFLGRGQMEVALAADLGAARCRNGDG